APFGMRTLGPISLILPLSTRITWFFATAPVAGSTTAPARITTAFWAITRRANIRIRKRVSFFTGVLREGTFYTQQSASTVSQDLRLSSQPEEIGRVAQPLVCLSVATDALFLRLRSGQALCGERGFAFALGAKGGITKQSALSSQHSAIG